MNESNNSKERVEKALNSLDGIRRAEGQPFLYTRIRARLQRSEKSWWESTGSFIGRPVVAIATLCAIVVFNGFILLQQNETSSGNEGMKQVTIGNNTVFTDNQYVLASSSSFDYENIDQQ